MKISETTARQDFGSGDLVSENSSTYFKQIKEMAELYLDKEAALASEEMGYYVVSEVNDGPNANKEALNWGVTCMYPVTVAGECCMTRGHFHGDRGYPEYYLCMTGEGYLLCWDGADEVIAYHMIPGSLQYIDGKLAHRLINTGDEMFKVAACFGKNAGHDYAHIENYGFPVRAFKKDGKLEWINQ